MKKTMIVSGARTPFGKFGGGLSNKTAGELGGIAIKETIRRSGIHPNQVQQLLMGNVLQGGQGQIPSRQAGYAAGLPWDVTTETINKVCASGMRSVTLADQMIRSGDGGVIVAGGMESMSRAPYFIDRVRWGLKMGDSKFFDLMVHDGLTCSFNHVHMGNYGNNIAKEFQISREAQDRWSLRSHERALAAIDQQRLQEEIISVEIPQRNKESIIVNEDEAPRRNITLEGLEGLQPAFDKDGTITAGNAPGVTDGGAALLLMSEDDLLQHGLKPLASIVGHAEISMEPENFPKTPGLVINRLLKKTNKNLADIDLFEINEAFAAVTLSTTHLTDLDPEKVNVNGGAVALGHPIGASGTRIILTLAYELRRRGGGTGIAAICSGGGQGDAVMIQV